MRKGGEIRTTEWELGPDGSKVAPGDGAEQLHAEAVVVARVEPRQVGSKIRLLHFHH
jgi:hypothetical protein